MKKSFLSVAEGRILLFQSLSDTRPLTQSELVEIIKHDTNRLKCSPKQMAQHNVLCFILAEVKKLNKFEEDEFEKFEIFCDKFDEFDQKFMGTIKQSKITDHELQDWKDKFSSLFVNPDTYKLSLVDAVNIVYKGTKNTVFLEKALNILISTEQELDAKKNENEFKYYMEQRADMYPIKLEFLLEQIKLI